MPESMSANEAEPTATDVVRAIYDAIKRRDFEAGLALLDAGFEWSEPEHALLGRRHQGIEEARQAAERQLEVWEEFSVEPQDVEAHGERVAVSVRQRARGGASGAEVEIRIGHLWTVRAGKIIALEVFPAAEDAHRAARLPAPD